jgi:hypothetical protein
MGIGRHEIRSDFGLRLQLKIYVDISVRWVVLLWLLVVFHYFNLKEALMDSFTSVMLFGAALVPVSG